MPESILQDEVYAIAGAAMEVYYSLGTGFLEPVYQEALGVEFSRRGIPFESEKELELYYKATRLAKKYIADFVCFGQIIIELKVVSRLTNIEVAQLLNYLKITRCVLVFWQITEVVRSLNGKNMSWEKTETTKKHKTTRRRIR